MKMLEFNISANHRICRFFIHIVSLQNESYDVGRRRSDWWQRDGRVWDVCPLTDHCSSHSSWLYFSSVKAFTHRGRDEYVHRVVRFIFSFYQQITLSSFLVIFFSANGQRQRGPDLSRPLSQPLTRRTSFPFFMYLFRLNEKNLIY